MTIKHQGWLKELNLLFSCLDMIALICLSYFSYAKPLSKHGTVMLRQVQAINRRQDSIRAQERSCLLAMIYKSIA